MLDTLFRGVKKKKKSSRCIEAVVMAVEEPTELDVGVKGV